MRALAIATFVRVTRMSAHASVRSTVLVPRTAPRAHGQNCSVPRTGDRYGERRREQSAVGRTSSVPSVQYHWWTTQRHDCGSGESRQRADHRSAGNGFGYMGSSNGRSTPRKGTASEKRLEDGTAYESLPIKEKLWAIQIHFLRQQKKHQNNFRRMTRT